MAVAITDKSSSGFSGFYPLWHRSAPRAITRSSSGDGTFSGWTAWQKHLAARKQPVVPAFLTGKEPPLLWGWPDGWERDLIQESLESPKELVELLLDEPDGGVPELPLALQCAALAYALPHLAADLPPETWWRIAEQLHGLAKEAQQHGVDWRADPGDVVRQQLLAGELPLALGYLFPEVRALRALRKDARAALSEVLLDLTDGQGLPHGRLLPVLGPLFACWTRARWLGRELDRGAWSRKAELQYEWLVRHAIRLADGGERFLLTPRDDNSPAWTQGLFVTALELVGDAGDCAAAGAALPRRFVPKHIKYDANGLPDPSLNSDWSGIAVLSNGWARTDARLAVAYAEDPMLIELSVDGECIFAGVWKSEVTCGGVRVKAAGEWERFCWESGKRFDYLELGIDLSHGLRLERQLLLGRKDSVLYVADTVVSADRSPRDLKSVVRLPLHANVAWQPELETRDGLIAGRKARVAVLPLALSEWRADPRGGSLEHERGELVLTQEAHGRALCCPIFFDFNRKRTRQERTWRQLTVAEWMEVLPHDVAVGYRAQSGRDQWLFYRSLGPAGNRTVLGQNTAGEFSAGPFLQTGQYKEWIEVEAV